MPDFYSTMNCPPVYPEFTNPSTMPGIPPFNYSYGGYPMNYEYGAYPPPPGSEYGTSPFNYGAGGPPPRSDDGSNYRWRPPFGFWGNPYGFGGGFPFGLGFGSPFGYFPPFFI